MSPQYLRPVIKGRGDLDMIHKLTTKAQTSEIDRNPSTVMVTHAKSAEMYCI